MYDTKRTIKSLLAWVWQAACRLPVLMILLVKETIEGLIHVVTALGVLLFVGGIAFFVLVFGPVMVVIGGVIIGCIAIACWIHDTYRGWERNRKASDKVMAAHSGDIKREIAQMQAAELAPVRVQADS